jgi:transcriptional regulator with XRE-family HTH domain
MQLTTGAQLRAARVLAGIEQDQLAEASGVSANTISRIERARGEFEGVRVETVRRLQRALEEAGVEFLDGDKPGVRMRTPSAA